MQKPNLISEQDLSTIKIKLGKSKRSEKDWSVIKELIMAHDLIVPESIDEDEYVRNIGGVMSVEGLMIAFSNPDDLSRLMDEFSKELQRTLRWKIKFLSFADLGNIADQAGVMLCIDMFLDGKNRFISYHKGRVEATTLV